MTVKYVLAILLIVVATPAAAEDTAMPRLGAHQFVPAPSIEEPFIVTQVETAVSLGQAISTSRPGLTLPDSTVIGGLTSEQFFIGLRFGYQHAMKEWLAVQVGLAASGRLGATQAAEAVVVSAPLADLTC